MTKQLPLVTTPLPVRLRVEDFLLLDASGAFDSYGKTELVDRTIYVMDAQHRPHMFAKSELAYRLRRALESMGSTLFVGIEGSTRLSDHDLPEPDILLTSAPRGPGPVPQGSVPLIVEVADTSLDTDLGLRAAVYATRAVPEYWVVDLQAQAIHQHWAPAGGGYAERRLVAFGEPLAAMAIAGLTINTAGL